MKPYEYGPHGFMVEDSNENTLQNEFVPTLGSSNIFHKTEKPKNSNISISNLNLRPDISKEELLDYIVQLSKEKEDLENRFSEDYKNCRKELINTQTELEQVKSSYRHLLSKFGEKEIQTRGYRLALNNANQLLYEVIGQIDKFIDYASIPLKDFINSMNLKIMKLLENSTKELQTLTDINPQS